MLAKAFNVDLANDTVVVAVDQDSAAAKAGILPGDVVVDVNAHDTHRVTDFYAQSALVMLGDTVKFTVLRAGKPSHVAIAVAAARP